MANGVCGLRGPRARPPVALLNVPEHASVTILHPRTPVKHARGLRNRKSIVSCSHVSVSVHKGLVLATQSWK